MYGVCTYSFHDGRVGTPRPSLAGCWGDEASLPADTLIDYNAAFTK